MIEFLRKQDFHTLLRLKKYIFFIAGAVFLVFWIHLYYSYLYTNAESEAIDGGTVSEAIIGSFPHFNPLIPSNDHNAYINRLLYRSLMLYDIEKKTFSPDLVSCNLENLLSISCSLENNITWSDGSAITADDILATYNIIKETKVDPILASLLENTSVSSEDNKIIFTSSGKDIQVLNLLLQPVLPKSIIESLNTETVDSPLSDVGGIYSGRFVVSNISQDETLGITKITLWKNKQYFQNTLHIDQLILNLFQDEAHFLKHKNSVNIFNDKDNIVGNSVPRLEAHEYTTPQFVAAFFNTYILWINTRTYISQILERDEIIKQVWENRVQAIENPFFTSESIEPEAIDFDLAASLKEKWYYSKKELLASVKEQEKSQEQESFLPTEEESVEEEIVQSEPTRKQEDLTYIVSPTTKKYNFVSQDNILLKGKVDADVSAVYINDYKLSGFSQGDSYFYYRLSEEYETIESWENSYKIYYEVNGEKLLKEEIVYIYETDEAALEALESEYFSTPNEDTSSQETPTETQEETGNDSLSTLNTSLSREQIEAFDDTLYYSLEGKPFTLRLVYADTDANMKQTADGVAKLLKKSGIATAIEAKNLADIASSLRNEALEYDIMLIGIDLWYFEGNIFPYLHSSQVDNGYNFSNYKKLSLDILLEELKGNLLSATKKEEVLEKILDILRSDVLMKVFYTPKNNLLIDRNIKNFELPSILAESSDRYQSLTDMYLEEKKIIASQEKSLSGFIGYLFKELFWIGS